MSKVPLVCVVDDDESVRESLPHLLRVSGFAVREFSSGEDFLASDCVAQTSCLVLDCAMPGMSGPVLSQTLVRLGHRIPTVFMTAHASEAMQVRQLAEGAPACLGKPFTEGALLAAIEAAVKNS